MDSLEGYAGQKSFKVSHWILYIDSHNFALPITQMLHR